MPNDIDRRSGRCRRGSVFQSLIMSCFIKKNKNNMILTDRDARGKAISCKIPSLRNGAVHSLNVCNNARVWQNDRPRPTVVASSHPPLAGPTDQPNNPFGLSPFGSINFEVPIQPKYASLSLPPILILQSAETMFATREGEASCFFVHFCSKQA